MKYTSFCAYPWTLIEDLMIDWALYDRCKKCGADAGQPCGSLRMSTTLPDLKEPHAGRKTLLPVAKKHVNHWAVLCQHCGCDKRRCGCPASQ